MNCESLRSLHLPPSMKTIGDKAFCNCSLESVDLNEGLVCVGELAFANNYDLKTIHLPSTVKVLGDGAFSSCTSLMHVHLHQEINLPRGNGSLGSSVFRCCSSLRSIEFGDDINTLMQQFSLTEWWQNGIPDRTRPDDGVNLVYDIRFFLPSIMNFKVTLWRKHLLTILSSFIVTFGKNCEDLCNKIDEYYMIENEIIPLVELAILKAAARSGHSSNRHCCGSSVIIPRVLEFL